MRHIFCTVLSIQTNPAAPGAVQAAERLARESRAPHSAAPGPVRPAIDLVAAMKNPKRTKRKCRVDSCKNTLSNVTGYHMRYKVCPLHASMASVVVDGETVRFCQRHGAFHPLDRFDDDRKSCREQLDAHNDRRKKQRAAVKTGTRTATPSAAAQQSSGRESPDTTGGARPARVPAAPGRASSESLPSTDPSSVQSTGQILVAWMSGQGRSQLGMVPRPLSGIAAAPLVAPGLPPGLNDLTLPNMSLTRGDIEVDSAPIAPSAVPPPRNANRAVPPPIATTAVPLPPIATGAAAAQLPPALGPVRNSPVAVQEKIIMASFRLFNAHPSHLPREVYNKLWEMVVICGTGGTPHI